MNVLLLDNSEIVLTRMCEVLADVSCIKEIYSTKSIDNLFSILSIKKPEVVLIDTSMPDKNGIDVLKKIKNVSAETKIILVTNYPTEHYKILCKENGADYFIDKSTEFEKIPAILEKECMAVY